MSKIYKDFYYESGKKGRLFVGREQKPKSKDLKDKEAYRALEKAKNSENKLIFFKNVL